jgi:chloride channel protein, CIC family
VQRFEQRIAIAALGASASAIAVARLLIGDAPDFTLAALPHGDTATRPLYFVVGALAGLLAVAYNRALLLTMAASNRLGRWPAELRAGLVGMAVGVLAWFAPGLVGGGDAITQGVLAGAVPLAVIPAAFLVRFALGAVSYAAGTPGGLFAPMLVLGAQFGFLCGTACHFLLPELSIQPEACAVVGIAAFFAGVVLAPITGPVLTTEMTDSVSMLLPILSACATAMLTPSLVGERPIYESLRERREPTEKRD